MPTIHETNQPQLASQSPRRVMHNLSYIQVPVYLSPVSSLRLLSPRVRCDRLPFKDHIAPPALYLPLEYRVLTSRQKEVVFRYKCLKFHHLRLTTLDTNYMASKTMSCSTLAGLLSQQLNGNGGTAKRELPAQATQPFVFVDIYSFIAYLLISFGVTYMSRLSMK